MCGMNKRAVNKSIMSAARAFSKRRHKSVDFTRTPPTHATDRRHEPPRFTLVASRMCFGCCVRPAIRESETFLVNSVVTAPSLVIQCLTRVCASLNRVPRLQSHSRLSIIVVNHPNNRMQIVAWNLSRMCHTVRS